MLLNAGVDLIELQNILGHLSLLTTAKYTHLTTASHENAYEKINGIIDTVETNWGGAK